MNSWECGCKTVCVERTRDFKSLAEEAEELRKVRNPAHIS